MKSRKTLSKIILITIVFFILCTMQNIVNAGEFIGNAEGFIGLGKDQEEVISEDGLKEISDSLLSILMLVGTNNGYKFGYFSFNKCPWVFLPLQGYPVKAIFIGT